MGLQGRQVSDDHPRFLIAGLTTHKQGAVFQARLLVSKTGYPCCPLLSAGGQPVANPLPALAAVNTDFGTQIDAQKRMPALGHDLPIEPRRVQASISQHQHRPLGGDHSIQVRKQRLPIRLPASLLIIGEYLPRHRNGAATHQHADTQHGEALSQGRRIECQGQFLLLFGPPGHHPAQQWRKTGFHL